MSDAFPNSRDLEFEQNRDLGAHVIAAGGIPPTENRATKGKLRKAPPRKPNGATKNRHERFLHHNVALKIIGMIFVVILRWFLRRLRRTPRQRADSRPARPNRVGPRVFPTMPTPAKFLFKEDFTPGRK